MKTFVLCPCGWKFEHESSPRDAFERGHHSDLVETATRDHAVVCTVPHGLRNALTAVQESD